MKTLEFVGGKHRDGFVAYPLALKGAAVGEGDTYDSALADARSAAAFYIERFGKEVFEDEDDVMERLIAEASLATGGGFLLTSRSRKFPTLSDRYPLDMHVGNKAVSCD